MTRAVASSFLVAAGAFALLCGCGSDDNDASPSANGANGDAGVDATAALGRDASAGDQNGTGNLGANDASLGADGAVVTSGDDGGVTSRPDAAVLGDASLGTNAGDGGDGTGAGDGGASATTLRHPYVLTGLLSTGQSLSVGYAGTPVLSTTQPYHNVRLEDSTADPSYNGAAELVPMVAPLRTLSPGTGDDIVAYPQNIYGETPSESAANEISALSVAADGATFDYPSATSNVGESGQVLTVIDKGGTGNAYAQSIREATVLSSLAAAANQTFGYGAIFLTHGESDWDNKAYEAGIVQLQADYDADLRAATGQMDSGPIPMFLTQQATYPNSSTATSASTLQAWQASVDHPTTIVCVGPKYQYEYFPDDRIHLLASGYVRLGEKYGEAYVQQVGQGVAWHPLQPLSVARTAGSTTDFVVHLDVSHAPLSWDPSLTTNHTRVHTAWAKGNGFEVSDSTGELAIAAVTIDGSDVHVTLAAAPTGTGLTVAYAMTQDSVNYAGGSVEGRHGALRDSDPFVGRDAETIAVTATNGSPTLTAVTSGAFVARGVYDRVTGGGVPDGVAIASRSGDTVTLSSNWTGASGTAMLTFAHEQRNYLVQFSLPVP